LIKCIKIKDKGLLMSNEIDPIQYGQLIAQVRNLQDKVDSMETDIKSLLELANKSKGGFWAGMAIASAIGGFITFIANHWIGK
jgi:hypothetical protein